ncbi:TolC family outer membrane protein [Permianibacter aggregans]|uniref:Outer membrane protein n=1 Tax=Permianibacter aggregans TaxID=1510150 RepID=A0A4R6UNK2_9GAMM|nr:TolC family outer membrane protein [Permianibacter aggregans]QGX40791.1 outer membrane channel protein TolC [Permianibacter aggregans]TDQ48392.1 outer membrane protein [Permianibacter aggregans]
MPKSVLTPIAAALTLFIGTAHAENLAEVFNAAVKNDPQFLAAQSRRDAAQENITQARATLLPQITGTVSASRTENTSSGTQILGGVPFPSAENTTTTDAESLSLSLNQQIYHHDTWINLSQTEKRVEQAELSLKGEAQNLVTRVAQAYFDVLAAQDGVEFSSAELEAVGKQLEQTNQRFQVGLIAITDVHEAQARYDQTQANLIAAQNTLDNAWEALRQITGQYYQDISSLNPKFPMSKPDPASADDWIRVAGENNLTLQSQRLAVDIARQEIKRNFAGHLPTLDLSASYTDSSSDGDNETATGTSQFDNQGENYRVGVTLTIPIFSGLRTSSQTTQAEHNFEVSTQDLERTHRQVIRDSKSAYLGLNASVSSVRALEQAEVSAQSALEATQAGFDVGTRTIVDVLQATSNLFQAKRNLQRARYDYVLNTLRLKAAAGTITEQDIMTVNSWLQP